MIHLALVDDRLVTIKEVSDKFQVSRHHLMKVVNKLALEGLIVSLQGRGGGIKAAFPASEVSVGQVVRKMEPSLQLIDCDGVECPISSACHLRPVLREATQAFVKVLDNYTIADVVKNKPVLLNLLQIDTEL